MLPAEKISRDFCDLERAREDSQALWLEVTKEKNLPTYSETGVDAPRRPEKLALNLSGRYHVGDGSEFPCELRDLSPIGLHLKGPREGRVGDWCTVNIASVGLFEGIVVQSGGDAFKVGLIALPIRIGRLASRFRWHLRGDKHMAPDRRASERVELKHVSAKLETAEGRVFPCQIFDISEGGASLHLGASALYFWVDQPISLDRRPGRVLRYFPGGVVIAFD